ncbi:hypothetical protein ACOMICROBIO_NCLOACGD_00160 [Vibrio sp. B1ASS3]|nr:hypothetical protein ACOMICROBIO_NCLOACGD_00160 [Vibrio sp. B1ASS3]CAE6879497.1 hypothetical protein ACOMICROBIO_NCLOACGD_00160 [Vibrio sp. B1ASS3]
MELEVIHKTPNRKVAQKNNHKSISWLILDVKYFYTHQQPNTYNQ